MKNVISFILFLIYTIAIFRVNDYKIIAIFFVINLIIKFVLKKKAKNSPLAKFLGLFLIILFTTFINILVVNLNYGILVGLKLVLVCNITYIFSRSISYMEFANVIEKLLTPLKLFKVNTADISIIICIAINFIPIFLKEFQQLTYSLSAKGIHTSGIYFIKNIKLILTTLIISIFKRADELEMSINAKGYIEE